MKKTSIRPALWTMLACFVILGTGAITLGPRFGPAALMPLYLLIVLLVAWKVGFRASIAVAICATLGLDFFFTEPRFTFVVGSLQDVFALSSFAAVSMLVSHLSQRSLTKSEQLRHAEERQRAQYELSRSALLIDWKDAAETQFCKLVQENLHLAGVALWEDSEGIFAYAGDAGSAAGTLAASYRARQDYDLPRTSETIRLLHFGVRTKGAILFRGTIEPLLADAVATLAATHLERIKALRAEVLAESQAVSEQLRTAVLDGLAHAVKTPLTTIVVSSSALREIGSLTPLQIELAEGIEREASRLAALTDKLLRTARLEEQEVQIQPRPIDLDTLFQSALAELAETCDTERVRTAFPEGRLPLQVDPGLVRMALVNVLENAFKYSSDASLIRVRAEVADEAVDLSIHNQGSFIPERERSLIFERYYRSPSMEHRAPGTGIGLSVARQVVHAHHGRLRVESSPQHGTTFHMTFPMEGIEGSRT